MLELKTFSVLCYCFYKPSEYEACIVMTKMMGACQVRERTKVME